MLNLQGSAGSGKGRTPGIRGLKRTLLYTALFGMPLAAPAGTLTGLEFAPAENERVSIRFELDEKADLPRHFSIEKPARIALDLAGTDLGLDGRHHDVDIGAVDSIDVVEAAGRTRAVVNLVRSAAYEVTTEGNTVILTVNRAGTRGSAGSQTRIEAAMQSAEPAAAGATGKGVTNIDFRRGRDETGRVLISLSDPGTPMNIRRQGRELIIDLPESHLPESLRRRLDVADFATPVQMIDAMPHQGGTRIVIEPQGEYQHLAYQAGNELTVEVQPVTEQEQQLAAEKEKTYTGERLTLKFQDIGIRPLLQLLADFTDLNIVISDSVQGNMSLRLQNVPWDQALDIILQTNGLSMRQKGNVILVAPTEEFAAQDRRRAEANKQEKALAPLVTEFVQVNYAKADDLAGLLKSSGNNFLSDRGKVTVDSRTNTLLVQDTAQQLEQIRELVDRLDVPVKQVLIESRIVVATDSFTRELGTRFGVTAVGDNGDSGIIAGSGSASGTNTMANNALNNITSTGSPYPVGVPSLGDRLAVDLPTANPAGSFALAILGEDALVDLEISAMQAEGQGEIISNPRVITSNNKKARIEQGEEIPYQEATSSGATNVEFKKAVLAVEVTPQITPNDNIIMDINVSQDTRGETTNGVPAINTREVETQVLMKNGETIVLGGIYEFSSTEDLQKVPFLGDIPGLGRLFKHTLRNDDKAELLIFVTPKIIDNELAGGR